MSDKSIGDFDPDDMITDYDIYAITLIVAISIPIVLVAKAWHRLKELLFSV